MTTATSFEDHLVDYTKELEEEAEILDLLSSFMKVRKYCIKHKNCDNCIFRLTKEDSIRMPTACLLTLYNTKGQLVAPSDWEIEYITDKFIKYQKETRLNSHLK